MFNYRYERYERALVKGHKQTLDRRNIKENLGIDMHKYKNQVIQSMQEGNKLRFVIKIYVTNTNYLNWYQLFNFTFVLILIVFICIVIIFSFLYMKIHIKPNGQYFSPGEARKAFGLYLGCILRKISQPNADPASCDLVMKFLQHSSCNLRTPFLFTVRIC